MDDSRNSPSSSFSIAISKDLHTVPPTLSSLSAVDPDQSILYPTNITQPEELLALSKEIFDSYDRHLSTATITRQIHEKLIEELDTSISSKEAELTRLMNCLQVAETKLAKVIHTSDVQDLKVNLEIELSNLLRAEAAFEEEREIRLNLEAKLQKLQEEEVLRKDQAIRHHHKDDDVAEQSRIDVLNAVIDNLEKRLFESDNTNRDLRVQLSEKTRVLGVLQEKSNVPTPREQLATIQPITSSIPSPAPISVESTATSPNDLGSQKAIIALAASRREVAQLSLRLQSLTSAAKSDRDTLQETQSELENQWKRADEHYDDIRRIRVHRDQLIESLARSDTEIADLEGRVAQTESERYALELELQHFKDGLGESAQITELQGANGELEMKTIQLQDMTKKAHELSLSLQAALQEISELNSRLLSGTDQFDQLRALYGELLNSRDRYLSESQEFQSQIVVYQDKINLLSTDLTSTKRIISSLQHQIQDVEESASQSIRDAKNAYETIREDRDRRLHQINQDLCSQTTALESLLMTQTEERRKFEDIVREKASAELEVQLSNFQSGASSVELQRLNKLVNQLKNDDSIKEVKIMQLLKSKAELHETMETLEIALDSKQQELELVKRKFGVRGVAGSVSAPDRTKTISNRRQSIDPSIFEDHSTRATATKTSSTPLNILTPVLTSRTSRSRSSLAMGTPGLRRASASSFPVAPLRNSISSASTDPAPPLSDLSTGTSTMMVSDSSTILKKGENLEAFGRSELLSSSMDLSSVPQDRSDNRSRKSRLSRSTSANSESSKNLEDKENILRL
ncbi:hypothetical protein [Phaffia rhodozyma]|uniref:Uncharacterized protein n=1 Tax=Phaffia rhodozyma TaxID=264483 RepID=A0A0F7SEE2_PHARH|nr:hypothetical protein [Phaffia rhodozyma]